ncbi:hypothetical protein [Pedobacter jeongneungensis]|uniref:hypothetical protein n=1 Tax=Pedobacter jeongneungensis TaxID=947309 RepID=UPI0004692306|nr:hypothetical protein [Pedobacter jeongneungensis]
MRTLIIMFFLGLSVPTFAQTGKLFKGTLNNSVKITLYLQGLEEGTNADRVVGAYKYNDQKGYLLLNGYRNEKGDIILVEQATPNFSGVFFGSLSGNQILGRWSSADQKISYRFKLYGITTTHEQQQQFQDAVASKAQEFGSY